MHHLFRPKEQRQFEMRRKTNNMVRTAVPPAAASPIIHQKSYLKSFAKGVQSPSAATLDHVTPRGRMRTPADVTQSRDTRTPGVGRDDVGVEDVTCNPMQDASRSAVYLQNHTEKDSERAINMLKAVEEEAIRSISERTRLLEAGIVERKMRVIKSVTVRSIDKIKSLSGGGSLLSKSDLFKLLDRRNSLKHQGGTDRKTRCDYKEFMFFDRSTASNLNNAIKTLGDPSFVVHYKRDYDAIALHPIMIGGGDDLGKFYGPTSVTCDERNMYVCDSVNCRVVVYGGLECQRPLYSIGRKGKGPGDLDRPSCCAVDDRGTLYVADSFNDRISIFNVSGDWMFNVGGRGVLNKPRGVACTADGETFVVSDTGNQRIAVYSGNGTYRGNFGKLGMKAGQFVRPQGIRISNNKVYVTDTWNYRIQIFDMDGKLLGSIGKQGNLPGEFVEPRDLAIDTNGNVLVTDTGKHTLQIFDKNGLFIREYGRQGPGRREFDSPEGIHTDQINRIFVADRKNNRVQIL